MKEDGNTNCSQRGCMCISSVDGYLKQIFVGFHLPNFTSCSQLKPIGRTFICNISSHTGSSIEIIENFFEKENWCLK